jgi:hypothetical protein
MRIMHINGVLTGRDQHALQTQFPPSAIELRNGPQLRLPSFHSASTTAAAANPIATPINGLSTANQKEMFQSELSEVGFLFMQLSQAFEDRHFTKRECERYETEASNKHRHGKQRSDLAELIHNVMRRQDDEVTCNVSGEEPASARKLITSVASAVVLNMAGSRQLEFCF